MSVESTPAEITMVTKGDQIGPYTLREQIVSTSGIELWTAKTSMDGHVYVQMIHLDTRSCTYDTRLPESAHDDDPDPDPSEGQLRLRAIAKETTKLLAVEGAPKVHAHGTVSLQGDDRIVYWGIELDDDLESIEARLTLQTERLVDWCFSFREALEQLQAFHTSDYLLGHLAFRWVRGASSELKTAKFLGLYVSIPKEWLANGTEWLNSAPFENEETTRKGDYWRLGKIFQELIPEPEKTEANALVEEYLEDLENDNSDEFSRRWIERLEAMLEGSSQDGFELKNAQKTTREERMRDPVLAVTPDKEISDEESSTGSSARAFSEAMTQQAKFSDINSPALESDSKESAETSTPSSLDPEAAAWVSPDLPVGASPWSEIVSAAETPKQKHSASDFPGFDDELPTAAPREKSNPPRKVGSIRSELPDSPAEVRASEGDESYDAVVSGFNVQKMLVGLIAMAAIFGGFFAMLRQETEVSPITSMGSLNYWAVSELNEVVLDSDPAGAKIISREDGLVLGQAPQSFLSPSGNRIPLLLRAPGSEAQSLLLPDRGRLRVGLNQISDDQECTLKLSSVGNTPFRAMGENIGSPPNFRIRGTAVVSAAPDSSMVGARLVRCPSLGGSSVQSLKFSTRREAALLHVTSPVGKILYVDGSEVGPIPQKIESRSSFVRLTIETGGQSRSWWVPMAEGAEVQLPSSERSASPKE